MWFFFIPVKTVQELSHQKKGNFVNPAIYILFWLNITFTLIVIVLKGIYFHYQFYLLIDFKNI